MNESDLKEELGRAYRALRGIYGCVVNGEKPNDAMLAYHSLTLGAAMRAVDQDALDGTAYFIGKPVEVLHAELAKYKRATQ